MSEVVNFFTRALTSQPSFQTRAIEKTNARSTSSNPFASSNPFINANRNNPYFTYGQNRPVVGGYFAGYYNNQPNIVGRKLFIEA